MMSNRVVIDADGMRVSAPGKDVLTASAKDLIFDSAWKQGLVLVRFSWGLTSSQAGWHYRDLPYTFDRPPFVMFRIVTSGVNPEADGVAVPVHINQFAVEPSADWGSTSHCFIETGTSWMRYMAAGSWVPSVVECVLWDWKI